MNVILERSRAEDVKDIVALINESYRGSEGWTTETQLVAGDRTNFKTIKGLMNEPTIHFLVAHNLGELLSCICVEHSNMTANIGFFAVKPKLQGLGIGHSVLQQAENFAQTVLNVNKIALQVIAQRKELTDYYLRRGYKKIGLIKPYPSNQHSGDPMVKHLTIEVLEKTC